MMRTTPKRRGKKDDPRRVAMGMRISPAMRDLLEASAQQSGRSLSQEIELRLEQSYRNQGTLNEVLATTFGPQGGELVMLLGRLIRHAPGVRGLGVEDKWMSDATAFAIAEREINHALKRLRPPGEPLPVAGEPPEHRADRLLVATNMIPIPDEWKEEIAQ